MYRRHPLYVVDAFTRVPFRGNPAAVCLLRRELPDDVLQAVAAEMNLSETAFVHADGGDVFSADRFGLRWFTPTVEVPLCGHATLASAKVLFDELGIAAPEITFDTRSGPLIARPSGASIAVDFAAHPPHVIAEPPGLRAALPGAVPEEVLAVEDLRVLVVRYASEADVRALTPDMERLVTAFPEHDLVVPTAPGSAPYDFVSRSFAPRVGIAEDPVTGMAHTVLGPYWGQRTGRGRMSAYQASRRGGEVTVELVGTGQVRLSGESRIVLRAYIDVAP